MLTDSQNSFTVVFYKTFAAKLMPHCPPHIEDWCHALHCETLKFKTQLFTVTAFTDPA